MALTKCRECGKEVSTGAKTCPHCGRRFPASRTGGSPAANGCLLLLIVGIVAAVFARGFTPDPKADPAPASTPSGPLAGSPDGVFVGAALAYLKAAHGLGLMVAQAEAGLNDGRATLNNLRDSAEFARSTEIAIYQTEYASRVRGRVPAAFQKDADRIDEIHRLLSAAFDQTATAAGTGSADGAASAVRTFRRALRALQAEVDGLNATLSAYELKARADSTTTSRRSGS